MAQQIACSGVHHLTGQTLSAGWTWHGLAEARSPGYLHDAGRYMSRITEVLGPQLPVEAAGWRNLEVYLEELPPRSACKPIRQ